MPIFNGFCSVSRDVVWGAGKRWVGWPEVPRGGVDRQKVSGRRENRGSGGYIARPMGAAAASHGVWADEGYALPGRQRGSESGFGPGEIMSCPPGAERGRDRAGRIGV